VLISFQGRTAVIFVDVLTDTCVTGGAGERWVGEVDTHAPRTCVHVCCWSGLSRPLPFRNVSALHSRHHHMQSSQSLPMICMSIHCRRFLGVLLPEWYIATSVFVSRLWSS